MINNFEDCLKTYNELGFVELIVNPLVKIKGLPGVCLFEVVVFENGEIGQVLSMNSLYVEVLTFSRKIIHIGDRVTRTGHPIGVEVGDWLLGRVVDPLCNEIYFPKNAESTAIETEPAISFKSEFREIYSLAPDISKRKKVSRSLETGVAIVDLMVPLGMGQRELVIGDRKTGKTNFLFQTIITQARKNSICIYATIGKNIVSVRKAANFFQKQRIFDKSIIVSTSSSDPVGLIQLTPYTAMTIAEYFRDKGHDVLLVLDDLTTHAKYYREISLLSKKFPGRASYPGDIFYIHSSLLERAGSFTHKEKGEVSITCLPVAEAVEGNVSEYIQTNIMSITDGHIFFDNDLFIKGVRPAVNSFLSVTRVGRQTQTGARWGINRELNGFLSLLEKTQKFVHFGAEINDNIKNTLKLGDRIYSFFDQRFGRIVPLNLQLVLFCMIWIGVWHQDTTLVMKSDIEKMMSKVDSDESYRKRIDSYVEKAADFNELLGFVSKNVDTLKA